jgi:SAM-dependent methyltransferase
MTTLLNLGCGKRFHPDWTNVDFVSTGEGVIAHDLRRGVPFPEASFDVVYHSHVLEHFSRADALKFLAECLRVLRTGGTIRIAVPDLEQIARLYLGALEGAVQGDAFAQQQYDWMKVELYDQTVRSISGGDHGLFMQRFLREGGAIRDFVLGRMGGEVSATVAAVDGPPPQPAAPAAPAAAPGRLRRVVRVLTNPERLREALVRRLLGPEQYGMLELGRFRNCGEIHLWMYDRYALAQALREVGFCDPRPTDAQTSRVPGWASFCLDSNRDGTVYKPDSLFMEAVKPVG